MKKYCSRFHLTFVAHVKPNHFFKNLPCQNKLERTQPAHRPQPPVMDQQFTIPIRFESNSSTLQNYARFEKTETRCRG